MRSMSLLPWILKKENMAEAMLCQFLEPGLRKLAASTSYLSNTCFWNQLPCCEKVQEAPWRGPGEEELMLGCQPIASTGSDPLALETHPSQMPCRLEQAVLARPRQMADSSVK